MTIPFLLAFSLRFVGQFFLGELIAIGLIPLAVRCRRWIFADRTMRFLFATGLLWLGSLVLVDLWLSTPAKDMFRGWGEIALTLVMLVVLRMVIGDDPRRLRFALIGLIGATIVRLLVIPTEAQRVAPWSLGGATALTIFALLLLPTLPRPFRRIAPEVVLMALAAFYASQNARNAAGITILTALFLGTIRVFRWRSGDGLTRRRIVTRVVAMAIVAAVVVVGYSWMASSGMLGDDAYEKYVAQGSGRYGILLGGRQDTIWSLVAVADSPIFGHGSRPGGGDYIDEASKISRELGYTPPRWEAENVPSHSYVLGAWVSAGIGGLAFWFVVMWVALRGLASARSLAAPWKALTVFLSMGLMWNWFFSPFGGAGRTVVPLVLLVLIVADRTAGGRVPQPALEHA